MPNEAADEHGPVEKAVYDDFVSALASDGIVIENGRKDFAIGDNPDWQQEFGNIIMHQAQFLKELRDFVAQGASVDRIYVEFLRWTDAYQRMSSIDDLDDPGIAPDIIQVGSTWTADFARRGIIIPIGDGRSEAGFFKSSLESCHLAGDDRLFAVPWFIDARLFYYWKNDFPNGQKDFETWDSFEAALGNVHGKRPFVMSIGASWNLLHSMAPWVWAAGADFENDSFVPGLKDARWSSKEFKGAVEYIYSLSSKDYLLLTSDSSDSMEEEFLKGGIGTILSTPDIIKRMRGLEGRIGISLPPAGVAGRYVFIGGSNLALTRYSAKKGNYDEGKKLIDFLISPVSILNFSQTTGFLPASKAGIDNFVAARPDLGIFKDALMKGRSYPSVPEWGEVFEGDTVRTDLSYLWGSIAQGKPLSVVFAVLGDISEKIDRKLLYFFISQKWHFAVWAVVIALSSLGAMAWFLKRRQGALHMQISSLKNELRTLGGQKEVVDSKIAYMERHNSSQAEELSRTKEKLSRLNVSIEGLEMSLKRFIPNDALARNLDRVNVKWDGALTLEGQLVKFENSIQARRLFDHIFRNVGAADRSMHYIECLTVFGMGALAQKSIPKRLCDTAIAKINSALKCANLPPVLRSCGRRSDTWHVAWDVHDVSGHIDQLEAREKVASAAEELHRGSSYRAADVLVGSLRMDPKCIEAMMVVRQYDLDKTADGRHSPLQKMVNDGVALLEDEVKLATFAISELKRFAADKGIDFDREFSKMESEQSAKSEMIAALGARSEDSHAVYLKNIVRKFHSISDQIEAMHRRGLSVGDVWAHTIEDPEFESVLSYPQIKEMVHNFYDRTTNELEDPRIVKLAMVLMLRKRDFVGDIEAERNSAKFFKSIEGHIRRQFRDLEGEFAKLL